MLEKRELLIAVARNLGDLREKVHILNLSATSLPAGMVPQGKSDSGPPQKTSSGTDKLLEHKVMLNLSINAVELKPNTFGSVGFSQLEQYTSPVEKPGSNNSPCRKEDPAHSNSEEDKD